jgi:hypothetical protein
MSDNVYILYIHVLASKCRLSFMISTRRSIKWLKKVGEIL